MRIAVVSLWTQDVSRTVHFYRDVIGLELLPHHGEQPAFEVNGVYLTILHGNPLYPENPVPPRFPLLAIAVDELDAAIDKLRAHEVEMMWGIEESEHSRWVMFYDPGGNLIELVEFK